MLSPVEAGNPGVTVIRFTYYRLCSQEPLGIVRINTIFKHLLQMIEESSSALRLLVGFFLCYKLQCFIISWYVT